MNIFKISHKTFGQNITSSWPWKLLYQFRAYYWAILITRLVSIAQHVTKNSIIRHLPHHYGISQYFQCQTKVDLGWVLSLQLLGALDSNLVGQFITYCWLISCNIHFSWPEFFKTFAKHEYREKTEPSRIIMPCNLSSCRVCYTS